MILEILFASLSGIIIGIFTGLMPGIHINLVSVALLALLPLLRINALYSSIIIISIAITHIFIDFIPTTLLGTPNPDNSMALLPSQELLLKGRGHEAITLSVIGCLLGILIIAALSPLLFIYTKQAYSSISRFIPYILAMSMLLLLMKEKNKFWAALIITLSSIFGILSFKLDIKEILFPMFSGLFGISSLVISIMQKTEIPHQYIHETVLHKLAVIKTMFKSLFASLLVGFLPGMGPAQASVIATSIEKENDGKSYILMIGAINSIAMVIAVIALFTIIKSRNGAIAAISRIFSNLNPNYFILFLAAMLFTAGITAIFSIIISKALINVMQKLNYPFLSCTVIMVISILVLLISGFYGFVILIIATSIGLLPILKKVSRNHLMSCLVVPVILYYLA